MGVLRVLVCHTLVSQVTTSVAMDSMTTASVLTLSRLTSLSGWKVSVKRGRLTY